jgi:hypothetical protein
MPYARPITAAHRPGGLLAPDTVADQESDRAGSMPAACRISQTVDGATAMPSLSSSPWIRRWPHSGFSRARRSTSRLILGVAGGRPGLRRPLVSYFFAASLRCQARSVAGVTGNTSAQRRRDTIRASAAKRGPLARTGPGRPAGAAPRSHAGAPAFRPLSPGRCGTARQPGRVSACGQRVDDLEQHPPSQPSLSPACWRQCRSTTQSSIRAIQDQGTWT